MLLVCYITEGNMSVVTEQDIQKINKLAYLDMPADANSKNDIANDLNNILELVNQIGKINTEDTLPMSHPYDTTQLLREDIVTEENNREAMQEIAPEGGKEAGLYLVPKVIE